MRLSWHARMFVLIVSQAEFSPVSVLVSSDDGQNGVVSDLALKGHKSTTLDKGAQMRPPVQPTITPAQRQSVVVVGGGFAGLNLIQHLRDAPIDIVLVDRCNHHLFQPLLYQVATAALAPTEIAEPTRSILRNARNVTVRLDEAIGVEPARRPILVREGGSLAFGHDTWTPFAPSLKTLQDATEIRRRLLLA